MLVSNSRARPLRYRHCHVRREAHEVEDFFECGLTPATRIVCPAFFACMTTPISTEMPDVLIYAALLRLNRMVL